MKLNRIALLLPLILPIACDDSDNPFTADQSSLAPPSGLVTVTGDSQIELRWQGANYEEDFMGYDVFQVESSINELKTSNAPAAPAGVDIAKGEPVYRCAANNSFFKAFGVTAGSDSQCDDVEVEITDNADTAVGVSKAKVLCYNPDSASSALGEEATVSLKKDTGDYVDGVGVQRCLIKGLTNGKTYSFIVVAVLGEEYDEISWTSNVVEDTPAKMLLTQTLTLESSTYATITLDSTSASGTPTVVDGTSAVACTSTVCTLAGTNAGTTPTIYLGRDSSGGSYPQRLFVSAGSGSAVEIAYRGPLTLDDVKGDSVIATSVPGDDALVSSSNDAYVKGVKFAVYDNMVFDIEYTLTDGVHYGKLVIDDLTYSGTSSTTNWGTLTFKMTLLMQTAVGNIHYIRNGLPVGSILN